MVWTHGVYEVGRIQIQLFFGGAIFGFAHTCPRPILLPSLVIVCFKLLNIFKIDLDFLFSNISHPNFYIYIFNLLYTFM